jgi:DNA-binding NarL/FixJ family response regulator
MTPKDSVLSGATASETLSPTNRAAALRRLLVVIHPRELLRAFLTFWLCTLSQDFEVISAPEAMELTSDTLSRACAAVIGFIGMNSIRPDTWLRDQIALLRASRPKMPIVMMCEEDIAEKYAGMDLQGYIPTSSSVELAAAAINLVTVGGRYIPYACDALLHSKGLFPTCPATEPDTAPPTLLTPREEVVLDLLQRGMPNKIIAHNLRISQSTVKAHVHSIIGKLDVHNRTQAAVTGYRIQPTGSNTDCVTPQSSNYPRQVSNVTSSGVDLVRRVNGEGYIPPLPTQASKKNSH